MPIIPDCADCLPLSLPKNVADYVTRQEVIDATSRSSQVQVGYFDITRGKSLPIHWVARNAGATGHVVLIPLSGNPDLRQIVIGSLDRPDFRWSAGPGDLRPGAYIEARKFLIPNAGALTLWVSSPASNSRFALLYWEN